MPTWTCPFCNQNATVIGENVSVNDHRFRHGNKYDDQVLRTVVIVCPNTNCREYTLTASLHDSQRNHPSLPWNDSEPKKQWYLIPASSAKPIPDYVPQAIRDDYYEACAIQDLSPKAAATLARRALQGMIRDFWSIRKARLKDEIEALEEKVDPATWAAIDAVRTVGNIGAHMEKDIDLIIPVEPEEAALLIGLIEMLTRDWYVVREERKNRLEAIAALAKTKRPERNKLPDT